MSRRGWLLFAAMCLIWGIPYLMIKVAVLEVAAPVLVVARTAVAAAVLLPLAIRSGRFDLIRKYWLPITAFAVLEIIGPWWLLADAERSLTSSTTGLLIAAVPIFSAIISRLTGSAERLTKTRWTGLLIGLAGVALLAAPDLRVGSMLPVLEVLLVAVGYASAPLIVARKLPDVPSITMNFVCLTGAALVYTPAAIASWPAQLPSFRALAALAGLGVLCTAIALVIFFALIREVGPTRAMVITYFNPAIAVVAGVSLLGEPLTVPIVIAFALILGGSFLATSRTREPVDGAAISGEPEPGLAEKSA
ncbi:DMT family transporter [Fodinicola acaciae]|uniref:DMT family transporter n=1 Tax=Fodinicola acaciae TaxID=2681555 RepID=UPI0013D49074|nr:DMT family transporter [Fodinicola acaciae]